MGEANSSPIFPAAGERGGEMAGKRRSNYCRSERTTRNGGPRKRASRDLSLEHSRSRGGGGRLFEREKRNSKAGEKFDLKGKLEKRRSSVEDGVK